MTEATAIEHVILQNLLVNEPFLRKVIPYLLPEYFHDSIENKLFIEIDAFVKKFNALPSKEALEIALGDDKSLQQEEFDKAVAYLRDLYHEPPQQEMAWLVVETEQFAKDKAVYNALLSSIQIADGKDKVRDNNAIPGILTKALSVSFNQKIGHDYIIDSDQRYEFYHRRERRIPFDLDMMNIITDGGLTPKTLNIILAGTGVGKSLAMCHFSAAILAAGFNALYITCEMSEERIAERIDANLLDISMQDLRMLPKTAYEARIERMKEKCKGRLIVKEYPTGSANVNHFRSFLDEVSLKKKFRPDIIFVDYMNICSSSRCRMGNSTNSYSFVKAIAEELRGLACEYDLPLVTATQANREGNNNSDLDLENTSDSFGTPMSADLMVALISTEELHHQNQILIKQLKNRYADTFRNRKFLVGVDKSKMRLYNISQERLSEANLDEVGEYKTDEKDAEKQLQKAFPTKKKKSNLVKSTDWNFA